MIRSAKGKGWRGGDLRQLHASRSRRALSNRRRTGEAPAAVRASSRPRSPTAPARAEGPCVLNRGRPDELDAPLLAEALKVGEEHAILRERRIRELPRPGVRGELRHRLGDANELGPHALRFPPPRERLAGIPRSDIERLPNEDAAAFPRP